MRCKFEMKLGHMCGARCHVEVISSGPPDRSLGEILRDPPKLHLGAPRTKERKMTEAHYDAEIKRLNEESRRLQDKRHSLTDLAKAINEFCPGSELDDPKYHYWTVVRADETAIFGGGTVRSAEFECRCGATMSITDGQAKVGGG